MKLSFLSPMLRYFRQRLATVPRNIGQFMGLAMMVCLGIGVSLFLRNPAAVAANNVILRYGPIERPLPLTELQAFVKTGEPTGLIKDLLPLLEKTPQEGQQLLKDAIKISPDLMDKVVNSYLGGVILNEVATLIVPATPGADSAKSLKTALVNGVQNNEISVLSLVQAYPGDMAINGERLLAIQKQVEADEKYLPEVMPILQSLLPGVLPGASLSGCLPPGTAPAPAPAPAP